MHPRTDGRAHQPPGVITLHLEGSRRIDHHIMTGQSGKIPLAVNPLCAAAQLCRQSLRLGQVTPGHRFDDTVAGHNSLERLVHLARLTEDHGWGGALIGTGFPFKDVSTASTYLRQLHALMPLVSGMRRAGSAALDLADVARGRFDAFWELWLNSWDLAAGVLLVREAGGRVTDLEGQDARLVGGTIVASNGLLHDWFLDILNDRVP